ncbi:hypothetical protein WMY93_027193 [Mugilogobius chulae]|uniref:Uncharacterized protein n=1 Tax=Mugilogobius chulae TaxID=88201 RepID=A0AAW0MWC5_9GOBI
MFGRSPRLPVDLAFGLPLREHPSQSHSQYVKDLRARLEQSYQLASKSAEKSALRNKSRFDSRVTPSSLEVGDRVLVRNVRLRGKHKLEDKWERDVFVVLSRSGDLPVYRVRPENNAHAPIRTLHRDLLLPCGFLPVETQPIVPERSPVRRPVTRSQPQAEPEIDQSEDELPYFVNQSPKYFRTEHIVPVVPVPTLTDPVEPELLLPINLPDPEVSSTMVTSLPPSVDIPEHLSPSDIEHTVPLPDDSNGGDESCDQVETLPNMTEPSSSADESDLACAMLIDKELKDSEQTGYSGAGGSQTKGEERRRASDQRYISAELTLL